MGNKCPADKAKEHVPRHYPSESSTHTSVRVDSEQDFLVNTPINRYGADGHKVKDSDTETVSSSATADETEAPKPGDPVNKECSFLGELYGIAIGALELELGSISQAVIILLEAYALGHVGEKALASFALSRIFVALMAVPPMRVAIATYLKIGDSSRKRSAYEHNFWWDVFLFVDEKCTKWLERSIHTRQIVSILCIHFGEMALAAQAVLVSVDRMVLVFTTGISTVFTAKLGNYLGAGSIKGAKTVFHASLLMIALIAAPMFYVLYTKADFWVAIYTQNKELLSMILSMKLAFSIAVSFEICAVCLVGILKAQGRQKVVTKVMFLAFYTFAIPLGIMLSYYYKMGLHGLWIGVASGFTLSALSYTVDLLNTDWKKQVDLCRLYLV
ncbi:Multidrug and toxin extrusion protein 1 [Zancudomyces culisetae]|uniref:Multidrug and toxin extrusion protein 1 n=1 Tax=Zancudomyces culisetae TaxID=1213189 RepID=A0A1R1PPH7_ZANCU|nr:Multidrug and toxin extrusion protein 1 [Zancudomyces culisetae]|eukprot:OMH82782.1 Multidrug and toxin extrusion protein 1 [Zancudomyces culisetae]